jgi:hypothetical protein
VHRNKIKSWKAISPVWGNKIALGFPTLLSMMCNLLFTAKNLCVLRVSVVSYIRKTPKRVGSIGALRLAEIASASTIRVSAGSIMPSSHSRALAW